VTSGAIAGRYARALFVLATAEGRVEDVGAELSLLADVLRDVPELAQVLSSPVTSRAVRKEIASTLCEQSLQVSATLRNFLHATIDNNRVRAIPDIVERYRALADEAAGRVHVTVKSAAPLSEENRRRLQEGLSRATGKLVTLDVAVDPSLIGGLAARVGHLVFDGSLRAQLDGLRRELERGV
jgi:F-type H+-transporting ATPase subunit delta